MNNLLNTQLVVASVIIQEARVLVTQRAQGSHLAGKWEFPGGKVEQDEDPRDALQRELREELGIDINVGDVLEVVFHRYSSKNILLLFFFASIRPHSPPPQPLEVAAFAWRTEHELAEQDFPTRFRK